MTPIKTVYDKRLMFLQSLASIYKEEGFVTRIDGRSNILEIYPNGCILEDKHYEQKLCK